MLFYRPSNISDIGFQLSFLSTLGILGIKPLLPFQKYFLVEDVGTTFAAQLATFPVLFGIFGQYGVLSILVNACVLWTIPYLMIFGSLAVVGGLVLVPLGQLFAWLSLPLLLYFEKVVSFFADLNWLWKMEGLSWYLAVGYYLILVVTVLAIKNLKVKSQKSKSQFKSQKF